MKSKLLNTNLNNYKIFYEVAKVLNISLASKNLLMTQANVSTALKKLEDEFQVELLIRKHKGVELTPSGKILYNSLQKSFGALESIESEFLKQHSVKQILKIGTTRGIADYFLPNIINKFLKTRPETNIQIYIASTEELIKSLERQEIDVIFDNLPIPNTSYKVDSCIVGEFENCFVCNRKMYSKINSEKFMIKDLMDFNLVLPGKSRKREVIDKIANKCNKTLNSIVELPNSKLMVDIIMQNECIGYVSEKTVLEELENKSLIKLEINEAIETDKIVMIYIPYIVNEDMSLLTKIAKNDQAL